jgi:diguanylate cyclase
VFACRQPLARLLLASAAAVCADAVARDAVLEGRIAEIERIHTSAPWQASAELVEALLAETPDLDATSRFRLDLVRARNLALGDELAPARELLESLGDRSEIAPSLRLRAIVLAINLATNDGDHVHAFELLQEGLELQERLQLVNPRLIGMAAYLFLRVGEEQKSLEYAAQAVHVAREGGDRRELCLALSDYGKALMQAGHPVPSEAAHREQAEACDAAGDPVFAADARRGVGVALASQGHAQRALPWLREALAQFDQNGYVAGQQETRMGLAEALLASGEEASQATELVAGLPEALDAKSDWRNAARAWRVASQLSERRGETEIALAQLRRALAAEDAGKDAARQLRLAYLQVQFETQALERRVAQLDSERQRQAAELSARQQAHWLQLLGIASLLTALLLVMLLLSMSLRQRRRFRLAAERDGLTGLLNHQHTRRYGQQAFERSRHSLRPFTATVCDIDRFKQINDRYGHAAGDAVLRELGGLMREVFPPQAVLGRSGGEEFTLLLEASLEQTRFLIEELRRRLRPLEVFGHRVEYTLSFGVCQATEQHTSLEELLRAADLALYRAKHSGRNRVVDATNLREAHAPEPGLVVIGSGIQLGRHLGQRGLAEIEEAEVVLALTDAAAFATLRELRPDLIDLRPYYAEGKDRRLTYLEMDAAIMAEVRAGRRVCAVFYGHPGVFADVPHAVVRKAREEGFRARMEPGISSEACLYADLGLDPGRHGVQSIEATQFLVEDRQIDNRSLVLIWQVALTGDLACTRFHAEPEELRRLVDRLLQDYPPEHQVILYEAAQLPLEPFRAERLPLSELPRARYREFTTLVIPPRLDLDPRLPGRLVASLQEANAPRRVESGKPQPKAD